MFAHELRDFRIRLVKAAGTFFYTRALKGIVADTAADHDRSLDNLDHLAKSDFSSRTRQLAALRALIGAHNPLRDKLAQNFQSEP